MIDQAKMRLIGGGAAIALIAGLGGYGVSRMTAPAPQMEEPTSAKAEAPANTVTLSKEAIANADIMVETVVAGGVASEIISQALVSPSPTGEAIVTARAAGAVTRVLKRLGDPVRAGEALAMVESRDAAQISADTSAALAKAVLAQKSLGRERYLYNQKVSARVDLEQAQAEAAVAGAEARRSQAAARAARVSSDGRSVVVASPISGRVTATTIRLGAFVQPEAELFRVSDPSQVQIEAAVGPADAARLTPGDRAIIELADGRTMRARVRAVTPSLNGETRSATAVLDLIEGRVLPGMAVRVRLLPSRGGTTSAIAVPDEAVQSVGGRDVVFVRNGTGFQTRNVRTGTRSNGRIEILSGIGSGTSVVTKGAFMLKAELGKSAGE